MSIKPVMQRRVVNGVTGWVDVEQRSPYAHPDYEYRTLYAIPDTHRVVPVELLRRVMTGCTEAQCDDLRAIIEDKENKQ